MRQIIRSKTTLWSFNCHVSWDTLYYNANSEQIRSRNRLLMLLLIGTPWRSFQEIYFQILKLQNCIFKLVWCIIPRLFISYKCVNKRLYERITLCFLDIPVSYKCVNMRRRKRSPYVFWISLYVINA